MSRHHAQARCGQRNVLVVAGYDRPLRELFLQVLVEASGALDDDEAILYASLHEPWRDWTDIATVTAQLERLGVEVPGSLLRAVRRDQMLDAGNRVVEHHIDRPPTVLAG